MEAVEKKVSSWHALKLKLLLILGVIGPGIITGTADNDAGGITTYSVVGSGFGFKMLWILFIIAFILGITQEMGARLGLVTGRGLAALMRENFSLKVTTFVVLVTFLANWANIVADFAGIASVADIYGVPRFLAVPLAAVLIWLIVRLGSFKIVQKVFLTSSILFFSYVIAGIMAKPDWGGALKGLASPQVEWSTGFFYTAVAMIGTTVTAWGQFFVQSYYVDKGVAAEHLRYSRFDIFAGSLWTIIVAFFIVVATSSTLYVAHINIQDAGQAAMALEPFAGAFAKHLFAWGLLNASLLGLAVVAMTSSYMITEAFGWEGRVDLKKESPSFYRIFAIGVFSSAVAILIPGLPLVTIIVGSQMLNTFVLPMLFVAILKLLNNEKLMGSFKNSFWLNVVSWVSVVFLVLMSMMLLLMTVFNFGA